MKDLLISVRRSFRAYRFLIADQFLRAQVALEGALIPGITGLAHRGSASLRTTPRAAPGYALTVLGTVGQAGNSLAGLAQLGHLAQAKKRPVGVLPLHADGLDEPRYSYALSPRCLTVCFTNTSTSYSVVVHR
jgi:hypothetical protein